jgi:hypothetical protein
MGLLSTETAGVASKGSLHGLLLIWMSPKQGLFFFAFRRHIVSSTMPNKWNHA